MVSATFLEHLDHSLLIDRDFKEDYTLLVNFLLKMVSFLQFLSKSHTLKSIFTSFLMHFKNQMTKVQKKLFLIDPDHPKVGTLGV